MLQKETKKIIMSVISLKANKYFNKKYCEKIMHIITYTHIYIMYSRMHWI